MLQRNYPDQHTASNLGTADSYLKQHSVVMHRQAAAANFKILQKNLR